MKISNGVKTFYLPEKLKANLRKIWGIPIFDTEKEVIKKYHKIIKEKKFNKIITVGDYCSATLFSDVKVFDGKVKRKKIKLTLPFSLTCTNPAGTIQSETWAVIEKAIEGNENIFVKGEEDLLVIPAVLLSKKNDAVIYGFPDKGVCLIEVSKKSKKIFKELLTEFRTNPPPP